MADCIPSSNKLLHQAAEMLEALIDGGCDHSVGICWCEEKGVIEQLRARVALEPTGPLLCDAVEEYVIKAFLAAGRRATDSELASIASRIRASETKPATQCECGAVGAHVKNIDCGPWSAELGRSKKGVDAAPDETRATHKPGWVSQR